MTELAFYDRQDDGAFVPTKSTVGPWDNALQHGGPPASLLGTLLERQGAREGTRIVQFALEFFGPVPLAPMHVDVEVLRPGKKIEHAVAVAKIGGRVALRASAWRAAITPGKISGAHLDAPLPVRGENAATSYFPDVGEFGYARALEWRFSEGSFATLGPATVWSHLNAEIIRGEPVSALARLLAMVDSANGISAEFPLSDVLAVPVNLTVSITRAPFGEWMGMRAKTSLAPEGIGTTRAELFDDHGFLGEALQTLFVEKR